ncbi:MAG: HAD-IIB family hydrolase [Pyramidobacter sp.]|uniref:HAD-IIB family hydrolase n=1 Tax=Pyramidobacter sp. TaxID=1943581 RepID=UPI002A7F2DB1|nr:HAD-IIB family hydrolase [Pyramidobacter sp.]MDY4033482.1 HAD-IIB family hydrolase [Pyramidobacter sp.]
MIKMIATDLDGTLLAPGGLSMPERNRLALEKAASLGVRVVVCTGRLFAGGRRYALTAPGDQPVICVNGAVVRMSRSETYLRRVGLEPGLAREALDRFRAAGAKPWFYVGDVCFAEESSDALDALKRRTGASVELVPDLAAKCGDRPEKLLALLTPQQVEALDGDLTARFGPRLYVTRSSERQIEALAPQANKGLALAMVARRFGVAREEIAAFGDSYNDLELFRAAGIRVAMESGARALKEQADIIAPPNGEGGVGQIVERLLAQRR